MKYTGLTEDTAPVMTDYGTGVEDPSGTPVTKRFTWQNLFASILGPVINGLTGKTTPVDADYIPLMDSAASNAVKKLSWANLKATLLTWLGTITPAVLGLSLKGSSSGTTVLQGPAVGTSSTAVLPNTSGNLALTNGVTALEVIGVALSDETTALTTGTAKATMRMPFAMTLTAVRASVTTAPTGGTLLTVDINEAGSTILSTKLTFDASEKTTTTAATPAVISDAVLADDAEMTFDIDAVGSTIAGAGLKVFLIGYRT